jgi:hypothetical protein
MMLLLAATLLAAQPAPRATPLYVACQLRDGAGTPMTPAARLYTGRHDRRFAARDKLFLDMRYDALRGTVAVTVVEAPHAPWSFGEKVVERERVVGEPSIIRVASVGPDATLQCGPP